MGSKLNHRETLIYLAGCIDCDGYLTIVQDTYRLSHGRAKHPHYYEKTGLKQTDPTVVNLLQDTFGGHVRTELPTAKNGKLLYSWVLTRRAATNAISQLLPFLRIKHKQAELTMELRASIERMKARNIANQKMPLEEVHFRSELVTSIRALNDIRTKRPHLL